MGARPSQGASPLLPRGPACAAPAAGVLGAGASLPQLLTLAKKKSFYLIHSPSFPVDRGV